MTNLQKLFKEFDNCPLCRKSKNPLNHILGGGQTWRPKVALVLINPTRQNISSNPEWKGQRFPFIGVTRFWRVLSDSGFISKRYVFKDWDAERAEFLQRELKRKGIYLTNLVKCCYPHGNYPAREVFNYHLPLFWEELRIVRPKSVIVFGTLTSKYLTGENIKMGEFAKKSRFLISRKRGLKVYPCYFPVGRGNSKLATQILTKLRFII